MDQRFLSGINDWLSNRKNPLKYMVQTCWNMIFQEVYEMDLSNQAAYEEKYSVTKAGRIFSKEEKVETLIPGFFKIRCKTGALPL